MSGDCNNDPKGSICFRKQDGKIWFEYEGGTDVLSITARITNILNAFLESATMNNTQSINFDTDFECESSEGTLCWSADEGTLSIGMPGGNVTLNVGQEMFLPRRVDNKTGDDMTNGQLVYISGGTGNNSSVSLAKADISATAETTIAMLTEDIDDNAKGYATVFGLVRDVDTGDYPSGTILYLSAETAGGYTDALPEHPNYNVKIGTVFRQHASQGSIVINIEEPICACKVAGGDDAVWDDLRFPFTRSRVNPVTFKPDFDETEIGLLFPQDDPSEEIFIIAQFPHARLLGSTLSPHVHYYQDGTDVPTFKIDYRIYDNGDPVPASWTTLSTSDGTEAVFPYDGTEILQIGAFPDIEMDGEGLSAFMDIKFYRDDDAVSGDVLTKEFDIHYKIDSLGSRQELSKG